MYTQLSDVEDETNGLYTYDRKVCKVDKKVMRLISNLIKDEIGKSEGTIVNIKTKRIRK